MGELKRFNDLNEMNLKSCQKFFSDYPLLSVTVLLHCYVATIVSWTSVLCMSETESALFVHTNKDFNFSWALLSMHKSDYYISYKNM